MRKVELEIVAISHSITQAQSYAVVLGEREGMRRLPIVIGGFEAQAIAVAIEKMNPTRPLTHDLFKNVCEEFGITIKEVIISNLRDGIFYATLICDNYNDTIEIDSRTSDALALAVRFDCPIYTYEFILEKAGIVLEEPHSTRGGSRSVPKQESSNSAYAQHSLEKLNTLLEDAISNEDYEKAAKIRDEIKRKS